MTLVDGEKAEARALDTAADGGGGSRAVRERGSGPEDTGLSISRESREPSSCPPGRVMPRLFERLPHGVRLTALGAAAAERARRVLRELKAADEAVDAVRSGRTGVVRVSATPPWAETVLAPAAARFHDAFPHIELRLDTTRAEGLRRLADGATDLNCGGIDADEPLPDFLRRERFLDMTAGVVASSGHLLLGAKANVCLQPGTGKRRRWARLEAVKSRVPVPSFGGTLRESGGSAGAVEAPGPRLAPGQRLSLGSLAPDRGVFR